MAARACEVLVRFRSAFEGTGFASSGAQGQEVGGAEGEHFIPGILAGGGTARRGDGVLPVAHGVQGAFEAECIQGCAVLPCALEHDPADQVVGDGVRDKGRADYP